MLYRRCVATTKFCIGHVVYHRATPESGVLQLSAPPKGRNGNARLLVRLAARPPDRLRRFRDVQERFHPAIWPIR